VIHLALFIYGQNGDAMSNVPMRATANNAYSHILNAAAS
jgi:hypothetical protein